MRTQHPLELAGFDQMVIEGLNVKDASLTDLLFAILSELKYLNSHMQTLTEEEIEEDDYQRL